MRLIDENDELIQPIAFIPAAERYHLMPSIDRWVIRTAFRLLADRRAAGDASALAGTYAINLSGASIGDDQFLDYVRESSRASAFRTARSASRSRRRRR